jgi:hypothetical protein
MVRLLLAGLVAAAALGYATGGRLGNLADVRFRLPWLGLLAIALQFVPVQGRAGDLVLAISFVLLLVVAVANLRLPGFALILIGLGLNFLVIASNHGMPVSREAIVASGQAGTIGELETVADPKHHLMSADDHLTVLADVIAIPPPIRQAVSVGDLAALAGTMWFVIGAMHHVPQVRGARDDETRAHRGTSSAAATVEAP